MLDKKKLADLEKIAKEIRKNIILMSFREKSAHLGGSLSSVEILTTLYFYSMKLNPVNPYDDQRDRLIFSKGHDCKVLYAVLAERGFFDKKLLKTHEKNNTKLPGHPVRFSIPGIEASTGSLGHGLSIAAGMAYAANVDGKTHRVFAILSDGECDEGSTWEAAMFAGYHMLSNMITIIDYNKLQGLGYTKDVLDLEPFAKKWESFKWNVKEIDGHNFNEIISAINSKPKSKPLIIIAHTIKGYRGPKQHINKLSSHYKPPTDEEIKELIKNQPE